MRDTIELASTPYGEDCAQVGASDYADRARRECRALIGQLRRAHGAEPDGAQLRVKSSNHDMGTYYEVAVSFDDNNQHAIDYAFKCEGDMPEHWDDAARLELGLVAS